MNTIQEQLQKLPDDPGVYLMKNAEDTVIYVGKAKCLKNRVRQYFRATISHTEKVRQMVAHVDHFEYIVTDSELEAFVLECNLIKQYLPKYNILLKDDKHYPFLKITVNQPYPRVMIVRRREEDGARYFGPYLNRQVAKETMDLLRKIFGIYTCKHSFPKEIGKQRPCLYYHLRQCVGVCTGQVSEQAYGEIVQQVLEFLEGKQEELCRRLETEMEQASQRLEFERAANLRDKLRHIRQISQKQKMLGDVRKEQDFIACARDGERACVQVFFVREGKLSGREHFSMQHAEAEPTEVILEQFIRQFYGEGRMIPREIFLEQEIREQALTEQWLGMERGGRVRLCVPLRGEKKRMMDLVRTNAQQALADAAATRNRTRDLLFEIQTLLGLSSPPRRIESYDISHTSGTDAVGSMVVFCDGKPKRSAYRKFRIQAAPGGDDYASLSEVIYRRIRHGQEELEQNASQPKFLPFPDLILLDGGKGQVQVVQRLLDNLGVEIPLFGMVKDDRHRTRGLTTPQQEVAIPLQKPVFRFLQQVQEEVHRTAISYHRALHRKGQLTSALEEIPGIGPAKRKALLHHFGSVAAVGRAEIRELCAVRGISPSLAEKIYGWYHPQNEN